MTNCITYVWRGEARRWLLLGRVPQNVHYDLTTYRSPRPCFHVGCLFKISMQASVISTCNLHLLAAGRRYLTDLSNVGTCNPEVFVHGASTLEITCNVMSLPNSTAAAAALCPPSREPADGAAQLVHVFISFHFFFCFHQSRFYVSFGVARSCMTMNKYPYQSNVSKR